MVALPEVGGSVADLRRVEGAREILLEQICGRVGLVLSEELRGVVVPAPTEKLIFGGVQAGKSVSDALEVAIDIGLGEVGREYFYWFVMPTFETAPVEMEYLRGWLELGISPYRVTGWQRPQGGRWRLELEGGRIVVETISATNPEGIASRAADLVVLCEAGQMPELVRGHVWGRIITRRGRIVYSGTLEDSEKKPQYGWYEKLGSEWLERPDEGHRAFSLPTWANRAVHPMGRQSPPILEAERSMSSAMFKRYFVGEPAGVQNAIYWQLETGDWAYHDESPSWVLARGCGGFDVGTTVGHPNALVAIQVDKFNIAVVRDAWYQELGDQITAESQLGLLSQKYGIPRRRWSLDPTQKALADRLGCSVAKMGDGSRMRRADMVAARLNRNQLKWDMVIRPGDVPSEVERKKRVRFHFDQCKRVHVVVKSSPIKGDYTEYARIDDDGPAAMENGIELLDDKRTFQAGAVLPGQKVRW